VTASGQHAYVADGPGGVQIFDAGFAEKPVRIASVSSDGSANRLARAGHLLFVAASYGGLEVIDISNPASAVRVSRFQTASAVMDVAVSGKYAYVANGENGLQIVEITNPANPRSVSEHRTIGRASRLAVAENMVFVATDRSGLNVIDVSNPATPVLVGAYTNVESVTSVALSGSYAYLAAGEIRDEELQVLDIRNPAQPKLVFEEENLAGISDLVAKDNRLYVSTRFRGVHIFNLTNPTNLVPVANFAAGIGNSVAVDGGRIYVANGPAGLLVVPTVPNAQFAVRLEATPGVPLILESARSLASPVWTPLLTTNPLTSLFEYVDHDVKFSEHRQKFYRVRQP
jgi:hypothetical protein